MIPAELNGAQVVRWSPIDGRHRPTGACRHTVGGEMMGPAAGLAICQYDGEEAYYLFYCDPDWNVITDTWHQTLEDAMSQAESEYQGVGLTWQRPGGGV